MRKAANAHKVFPLWHGWKPVIPLLVLALVACAGAEPPDAFTSTPSVTPIPSPSVTASPSATPTPTCTPTSVPTPELSDALISDDFLFEESSVPGCELPCWQGLVVGTSGREDIQHMFDTVFAFHGSKQFIPDNPPVPKRLPKEYYAAGNDWPIQGFTVVTYYERVSFTLSGLKFSSTYTPFNMHITPYRIIRELGQPSRVLVSYHPTTRGDIFNFQMFIIYNDEGMVFHFTEVFVPGSTYLESPEATQLKGFIKLCLYDEIWQTDYVDYRVVTIFESLDEDINNLNPLQEYVLHFENTTDFSDFFGVSLEELTQMATSDDQTCLRADFAVDWLVP